MGASGGSGRSTVSGLLAASLSTAGSAIVLDTAPRLASPWPAWPAKPGAGLASLPPDEPFTRAQVQAAASELPGPGGNWHVLTDHQEWHHGQLSLPSAPAAWYQLASGGGWQAVVADTTHPVAHDIVTARAGRRTGQTAAWCSLPFAVPVLCALATGPGVAALQTAVKAASAEGLPLQRTVVALSVPGEGRLPPPVKAAATMLQPQVSAVVTVPFDSHVRGHGMAQADRLGRRTYEAGAALAAAVLDAAHRAWGHPLPAAPVPAALPDAPAASVSPNQPAPEGVLT
ncbi:hypothetical protein Srubr_25540 [Streptomyces rubradiris]|uniref:MinD-like ATPase involved in chromosome partitioning or flagellar assembly n=1 Tax=Streptomyces rubradiris TaxID=285531 RepID=A0ABQ3RA16_STRRR|nr:hypothetical protein Srubr_25540 [Streptomyces rubradiris]